MLFQGSKRIEAMGGSVSDLFRVVPGLFGCPDKSLHCRNRVEFHSPNQHSNSLVWLSEHFILDHQHHFACGHKTLNYSTLRLCSIHTYRSSSAFLHTLTFSPPLHLSFFLSPSLSSHSCSFMLQQRKDTNYQGAKGLLTTKCTKPYQADPWILEPCSLFFALEIWHVPRSSLDPGS